MRWVMLADDWPPQLGGVASWGFEHARGLVAQGHDVRVFARARPGLWAPDGVTLTPVYGPSFGRHGGLWTAARALRAVRQADRVLATTWTVASGLAGRVSTPIEVVFHGSDATRPPLHRGAFERTVRNAASVWAVSDYLVGVLQERGIDAERIGTRVQPGSAGCDPNGPWAFVARATPLKGGDRFIALCAASGHQGVVVGDGPALAEWRTLAASLKAPVRFTGALPRADTARVMRSSSAVFLLPRAAADGSGAEGLGLVLLEARAMGVPVVGCATGGVPEALGDGGILLEHPDDVVASLRDLQRLL